MFYAIQNLVEEPAYPVEETLWIVKAASEDSLVVLIFICMHRQHFYTGKVSEIAELFTGRVCF